MHDWDVLHADPGRARDRARIARYPAGARLGARTLHDHELVLILSGSAVWISDGERVPLEPGTVVLARPGTVDEYHWDPVEPTRHAYVHFEQPAGAEPLGPLVRRAAHAGTVGALFRYLVWLDAQPGRAVEDLAARTFEVLLTAVVTAATPELGQTEQLPPPLRAAVDVVRELWADGVLHPVAVERLAAAGATSTRTLARCFQEHLGYPPARALEAVRLTRAAALVRGGRLPLREVAAACGFADAFHLSRRIRAVYGVPPAVLRSGEAGVRLPDPFGPGVRRLEHLVFELPGVEEVSPPASRRPPRSTGP